MALRDEIIAGGELQARVAAMPGWATDGTAIYRTYEIPYDNAIKAVGEIGRAAVELEHRPDIDVRWSGLTVHLTTHTAGDVVTELDLAMAARVDQIAARHGAA